MKALIALVATVAVATVATLIQKEAYDESKEVDERLEKLEEFKERLELTGETECITSYNEVKMNLMEEKETPWRIIHGMTIIKIVVIAVASVILNRR